MQSDLPPSAAPPNTQPITLQRLQLLRQAAVIGLVMFSLLILLLALYLISTSVQNDIARSEANVASLQNQVLRLQTPAPAVQELLTTLSNTLTLADKLTAARPPTGHNWPTLVAALGNYDPAALTLTALRQDGNRITLTGQAGNDSSVVAYVHRLEGTKLFTSVVLESIVLLTPTPPPTAAANATTTPAGAAPTVVNFVITIELSPTTP